MEGERAAAVEAEAVTAVGMEAATEMVAVEAVWVVAMAGGAVGTWVAARAAAVAVVEVEEAPLVQAGATVTAAAA